VWPLDAGASENLRWYLEDYLQTPFGVYGDRGAKVAAQLQGWGESIFRALFSADAARDAYARIQGRNAGASLVLRSSSPSVLGLPWELLVDPGRSGPLAFNLMGVTRSLPDTGLGEPVVAPGERLRVLMVISRPGGAADVGYRLIARPLIDRLDAVRGKVELVVLRPPTLGALKQMVVQAKDEGRPFQIVHFDGHGKLERGSDPVLPDTVTDLPEVGGLLAFEEGDVRADDFARVLNAGGVPLVVLNACQSGAVGTTIEASVAARLIRDGTASVVAMGYSIYTAPAAQFMTTLYERLFAGDGIVEAVSAARRSLYEHPERPSAKGLLPLADWVVPVHYLRSDVRFPQLRTAEHLEPSLLAARVDAAQKDDADDLQPVRSFVGRDGLFYELEVGVRGKRVVLLHGQGGTGKTELAKAFARWWRDTGGAERPEYVVMHSFEPGVAALGLDEVVSGIGRQVFGDDFPREVERRRRKVEELLTQRALLLVWDNFESVFAMPDPTGATPPLDEDSRRDLSEFLNGIAAGGRSAVVLTSRTDEAWLTDVHRIPVAGLAYDETVEYADQLLASCPDAGLRRTKQAFGELLEWLDGHPLSMRLVLPHLQTTEPEQLLSALSGSGELPATAGSTERTTSLSACVGYSFEYLHPATRKLLVAVCLFQGVVDVDVLARFSEAAGIPERFAGAGIEDWAGALDEAARVGLLTPLRDGMYRIHPALPTYLTGLWRDDDPAGYERLHDTATRTLVVTLAVFGDWLHDEIDRGDAGRAFRLIEYQRRTFGRLLNYALQTGMWEEAWAIGGVLDDYWDARGLTEEAHGWASRVRQATEGPDGVPPGLDAAAGKLWLFFVGSQANREADGGQIDVAEHTYREILGMLEGQPASEDRDYHLAITYGLLGTVAQDRGHLDEAEEWYRRSLRILEEFQDRPRMASTYHDLGVVAQERQRLEEAEDWHRRALRIFEELHDRPRMAVGYRHLGIVAQRRSRLDEAGEWFRRSLGISKDELGDRPAMASVYINLGALAEELGHLEVAEERYQSSLTINERLKNRRGMAAAYQGLGIVAHRRGQLEMAEEWYRFALRVNEGLQNKAGIASAYLQLGRVAEDQGKPDQAMEWTVRLASLAVDFPHLSTSAALAQLARLTTALGPNALETCWQRVTDGDLPPAVRDSIRPAPRDTQGQEENRMSEVVGEVSRATAQRLVGELGPELALHVEAALDRRRGGSPPQQFFDPVSLGGVVVSAATLAWTIVNDRKSRAAGVKRELVTRRVRVELKTDEGVTVEQRDRIIDVVVDETFIAELGTSGEHDGRAR